VQPRKVVTAAQMRAIDQKTVALGIPSSILMENAAHRVVEFLVERFSTLNSQRIVVFCGKGSNGGDALAVARQLLTRFSPRSLDVLLAAAPEELAGDAALNYRMFTACGGQVQSEIEPVMQAATLIVDGLLGSGLKGPAKGRALGWIRAINEGFPSARVVAIDVPSGMPSDSGERTGEYARADATVTFTAPRMCHVLAPLARDIGELRIAPIGTPPSLYQDDASIDLALVEPRAFRHLIGNRNPGGNKGDYGHVLVVAGSRGKTGAATMSGTAALHAGAGLVTVGSSGSAIPVIAAHATELMTELLPEAADGSIADGATSKIAKLMEKLDLLAMGPGLGTEPETAGVVRELWSQCEKPGVFDADALNILAEDWVAPPAGKLRVLTPHPGEMSRLAKLTVKQVQADRIGCARKFATEREVTVVLKGECTLIAFPDGRVWINPTGSPSMATGGTGDVLTGMVSGFLAQFPKEPDLAIAAAVWLHGRAGQLGADEIGEQPFVATDLLRMLPEAMRIAAKDHV
jgi:NAD(P)H-hydrate epimerase